MHTCPDWLMLDMISALFPWRWFGSDLEFLFLTVSVLAWSGLTVGLKRDAMGSGLKLAVGLNLCRRDWLCHWTGVWPCCRIGRQSVKGTFVKTLTVLLAFQVHHGDILGGRGHLPAIPDSTSLVNAFGLPHHLASYLQHLTSALSFGTVCLQSSIDLWFSFIETVTWFAQWMQVGNIHGLNSHCLGSWN